MSDHHPTDFTGSIDAAITSAIVARIPDAKVEVSGGGGHFRIAVVSTGRGRRSGRRAGRRRHRPGGGRRGHDRRRRAVHGRRGRRRPAGRRRGRRWLRGAPGPRPPGARGAAGDDRRRQRPRRRGRRAGRGQAPFVDEPAPYDLDPSTISGVAGAGNDALKAVQSLPGVARIPFGLGGLVLRGQSPRNSSVFLDGVEVPLLYHFGGLASFIPTPMLDGLEVMPGTFGARFGRTQGGVVEVRSRAARTDRWRGATEVSLIDAQARARARWPAAA
jgi:hypothetical protein